MIRRFFIIFCFAFLTACNDGDILTVDLDFDRELKMCNNFVDSYVIYDTRKDPNESLILVLPKPLYQDLFTKPTPEGQPVIIPISANGAQFNYRTYNIDPANYLCDVMSNSDLIIREDYVAESGTVEITVTIVDDDNDGIPSEFEGIAGLPDEDGIYWDSLDSDGDGIPDYLDQDDDNDNVKTINEIYNSDNSNDPTVNPLDTDGDGIPDYLDPDDDGDGILTILEDANSDKNPMNDLANNEAGVLVPHYLNPAEATAYPFPGYTNTNVFTRTVRTTIVIKDVDLEILRTTTIQFGTLITVFDVEMTLPD